MTPRKNPTRTGISILEISAGAAMLTVLLTMVVQMLLMVRQHSRRAEERASMVRVVENLMEECTAGSWEAINDDAFASLRLPEEVQRRWPQARLAGQVAESSDRAEAKQITLTLSPGPDSRERPVALTTWVFKAAEEPQ